MEGDHTKSWQSVGVRWLEQAHCIALTQRRITSLLDTSSGAGHMCIISNPRLQRLTNHLLSQFTISERRISSDLPKPSKYISRFNYFPAMSRQKTLSLEEGFRHEESTQKQDRKVQVPIAKGDPTDHQDRATERRTTLTTPRIAPPAHQNNAHVSILLTKPSQAQDREDIKSREAAAENSNKRPDDSTNNPTPSDPITSKRTLDFINDLLTPLQTVPTEFTYETLANACESGIAL